MLPFKNKNYFTLDNLSKYGHITLKFVCRYFTWLLQYFPKIGLLYSKNCVEKKSCQNPFSAILRLKKKKKFRWPLSSRGGKALVAWPLVDELFFCGFPYQLSVIVMESSNSCLYIFHPSILTFYRGKRVSRVSIERFIEQTPPPSRNEK